MKASGDGKRAGARERDPKPGRCRTRVIMSTISREDACLAYEVRGPAGGEPVVLLHNIFCDRRVFDGVVDALAPRYRTIAVDFRGHGESTPGSRPYAVADLVADVVAILDREGLARAHVVGLSLGATVALELALAHPQRVHR